VTSTGPEHDKEFTARAVLGGVDYGEGTGRTKKEAEQHAAAAAYQALEASPAVDPDADAVSNA
jgi:ribonuclease III